jgi:hypothetical protein
MQELTRGQKISKSKTGIPRDEETKNKIRATKQALYRRQIMLIEMAQELTENALIRTKMKDATPALERLAGVLHDLRSMHKVKL